ncbi:hypothetical protein BDW62DRAFT_24860 [Aspergillus aurantiobrunneus]
MQTSRNPLAPQDGSYIAQTAGKNAAMAIIGIGCRLPGGISSPSQLWDFLAEGRSATGEMPKSRFNIDSYQGDKDEPATIRPRGGYFLEDDIRHFDNQFFGINNREAATMDPQQRKLLEVVFEAFESAGVTLNELSGANVGCYVASFTPDFIALQTKDPESLSRYSHLGLGATLLGNRISHVFNLKGPSCVIDTACSSSLYALHAACVALQNGECESAIVAGVNLIQSPELHVAISQAGLLSPSSTCQTFDSAADGYARGDGINAIYIKRLDDAVRDQDAIRSIIRATAVNSNGRTPGISQPSVDGQEVVIRKAYARAELDPAETAYVETHGTGTSIGDPVEVEALSRVFRKDRRSQPALLGSVKPNLGHGEASSGLLSIIKAILALERGQIPPTISVKQLNPKINTEEWGVEVVTRMTPFPSQGSSPRRISISSFGYGGANAHGIVEEAGPQTHQVSWRSSHPQTGTVVSSMPYILPFSANKVLCLNRRLDELSNLNLSEVPIRDLAYTLGVRRSHLSQRGYVIAQQERLVEDVTLDNFRQSTSNTNLAESTVVFAFTGQGAQWTGMGRELLQFPAFADTIYLLDHELHRLPHGPPWKILDILLDKSQSCLINKAELAQPITTAVQIGLVDLLRSWRIQPRATIGHSSGEIAAAYTSGLLAAREAIIIAYYRGYVVSRAAPGGLMAAVGLHRDLVVDRINRLWINANVTIACINSPENVTVSGDCDGINSLVTALRAEGIFARELKTDGKAYHSHHMASVGRLYQQLLDEASVFGGNESPDAVEDTGMYSTVACKMVHREIVRTSAYWRANLESPVQFSAGLTGLSKLLDRCVWIEIGPHAVLKLPIMQTLGQSTTYLATLKRDRDSAASLLACVGELFIHGFNIDFSKLLESYNHGTPRFIYDLPTYPWHYEEPLWSESRISRESRHRRHPRHELLGGELPGGNQSTFGWRNILQLNNVPWLRDHKLDGTVVFPAVGYLAMAVEALMQKALPLEGHVADNSVVLRQVLLPNALPLSDQESIELYTELRPYAISSVNNSSSWWEFQISSISDDSACVRAKGQVRLESAAAREPEVLSCPCRVEAQLKQLWYESIARGGLYFGPTFQHMHEIYTPESKGILYAEASTRTLTPSIEGGAQSQPRYLVHPTLLDALLQVSLVACTGGSIQSAVARVPTRLGHVSIRPPTTPANGSVIRSTSKVTGLNTHQTNAVLFDAQNLTVAQFAKVDFTTFTGNEKTDEIRHPITRVIWRPDIDLIDDDCCFTTALEYVLSVSHLSCFGPLAHILAAIDMIVHKDPGGHILCLSTDFILVTVILLEVLNASNAHRRFDSFSLGQLASDGTLEIAEIHNYNVPLGLECIKYHKPASNGIQFSLVIFGTDMKLMDQVSSHTNADTVFLAPRLNDNNSPHLHDQFSLLCSYSNTAHNVQLLRKHPVAHHGPVLPFNNVIIVGRSPAHPADERLARHLIADLHTSVQHIALNDVLASHIPTKSLVVSTLELERSLLSDPNPEQFDAFKKIIEHAAYIVWLTGSGTNAGFDPTLSLFTGLARAVLVEQPLTKIFAVELDPTTDASAVSRAVFKFLNRAERQSPGVDCEYILDRTNLMISRIVPDYPMNHEFRVRQNGIATHIPIASIGNAFLSVQSPTQLDAAQYVRRPFPDSSVLGDEDIVVKVSCVGLNAKDVYALAGRLQTTNATCSSEYTGHIVATGSTNHGFAVGDKVAVVYPGRFGTYEVVPAWSCVKLQHDEDLHVMAGVLVVFVTAVYALYHRAHLQRGESILIHSAAGGVGIATVQVAKLIGAEIFATVGTEEKKQYLIDTFGLRADHIFQSHDAGFAAGIRSVTHGRGVDVVLNSLVGELLHESWECLADWGRFVEIGKRDIVDRGRLDMEMFSRGTTFTAFDISMFSDSQSPAIRRLGQEMREHVMTLLRSGDIQPVQPLSVFKVVEIDQALNHFKNAKRLGKIVVSYEDESQLVPVVQEKFVTRLNPHKCYLLVGCLGGLGRSLSKWMIDRGARHFVFLGRTGLQKPAAKRLIEELEQAGAHCTVIAGDVTNYLDVERAVQAAGATVPLGGVVQAAMGLHEAIFKDMTREAWQTGTLAKVQGTWNLHRALSALDKEKHLDFFLLTSSIAGKMGTATEANYCAANNFLDTFARYRRSLGLPAVSLGLGMVSEVGYLHENLDIGDLLLRKGIRPLLENEVLQIVDFGLSQQLTGTSVHPRDTLSWPHILTGLEDTGLESHGKNDYTGFSQYIDDPRLSVLRCALQRRATTRSTGGGGAINTPTSIIQTALASGDNEQLQTTVLEIIAQKFCSLILLPLQKLDADMSMMKYGIDSMLAAELRRYIFNAAAVDVPFFILMDQKTSVSTVAGVVVDQLRKPTSE